MYRPAILHHRQPLFKVSPHGVGDSDRVAVHIHAERGNDVCLGTDADGGADRLAGKHVCTVQFACDHPVQQHFPVGLCFQRDGQSFILEVAFVIGDGQRHHIGQLDEAELQRGLFGLADRCLCIRHAERRDAAHQHYTGHGCDTPDESAAGLTLTADRACYLAN